MHLGCEDDTAAMQLKVAQIGPLLPPPQRRHSVTQGCLIYILDIAQILVQSHFELVSLILALEAAEMVSERVTVEDKQPSHFSTVKTKRNKF